MAQPEKRKPGRPKGSKNKVKKPGNPKAAKTAKRGPGRPKGSTNVKRGPGRPKGIKNKVGRPALTTSGATRTVTISASIANKIEGLTLLGKGKDIEAALDRLIK